VIRVWRPRGVTTGRDWTVRLDNVVRMSTGKPAPMETVFAEICRPVGIGRWTTVVRMDASGRPGVGPVRVGPGSAVLTLPAALTRGMPAYDDAVIEVWATFPGGEPYCLIPATKIPIIPHAAELP
jgi:hypothetical protein